MRRLITVGLISLVALPIIAVLPGGQRLIDVMPFIGRVDIGSITYREQLFDNALTVIARKAFFGSADYLMAPEMQAMIQGQGIIDIVNTYLGIALKHGLVGLGLFVGFFCAVLLVIRKAMRTLPDRDGEVYRLGSSLFATIVGILVIIFTVSSITIIPVVYWSVAGMGVAYAQMVKTTSYQEKSRAFA
jgi:O-antigen ligase